jgi:hypothetical protein
MPGREANIQPKRRRDKSQSLADSFSTGFDFWKWAGKERPAEADKDPNKKAKAL